MAKGQRRGNREAEKPKKEKPASSAAPVSNGWLTVEKLKARDDLARGRKEIDGSSIKRMRGAAKRLAPDEIQNRLGA